MSSRIQLSGVGQTFWVRGDEDKKLRCRFCCQRISQRVRTPGVYWRPLTRRVAGAAVSVLHVAPERARQGGGSRELGGRRVQIGRGAQNAQQFGRWWPSLEHARDLTRERCECGECALCEERVIVSGGCAQRMSGVVTPNLVHHAASSLGTASGD